MRHQRLGECPHFVIFYFMMASLTILFSHNQIQIIFSLNILPVDIALELQV